jgi:hypothetical protein
METSLANDLHDAALQSEKVTAAKLRECWNLITELEKHGLDIMMKIFLHLFEIYYLNILYSTIREIASKNGGIIYSLAVEQMFESLERQYDIKLKLWKLCKGNISY